MVITEYNNMSFFIAFNIQKDGIIHRGREGGIHLDCNRNMIALIVICRSYSSYPLQSFVLPGASRGTKGFSRLARIGFSF